MIDEEENREILKKIRPEFEKRISYIIKGTPSEISLYFFRNIIDLKICSYCGEHFFIKEIGLTKENISILFRCLHMNHIQTTDYCIGFENQVYTLCYKKELCEFMTTIRLRIFNRISNIAFSLMTSELLNRNYQEIVDKAESEVDLFWRNMVNGILALNNIYKKNQFKRSMDILTIQIKDGDIVLLHGHQIEQFRKGIRPEKRDTTHVIDIPIKYVYIGHYHRLGIFKFTEFQGIVCIGGSMLYPHTRVRTRENDYLYYFPEMISDMGTLHYKIDGGNVSFIVERMIIDIDHAITQIVKNETEMLSIDDRLDLLIPKFKVMSYVLPGNHDPFDIIYINKNNILNDELSFGIGMGDYIKIFPDEYEEARGKYVKMFSEMGYEPYE
jgi:hypothetical protein